MLKAGFKADYLNNDEVLQEVNMRNRFSHQQYFKIQHKVCLDVEGLSQVKKKMEKTIRLNFKEEEFRR